MDDLLANCVMAGFSAFRRHRYVDGVGNVAYSEREQVELIARAIVPMVLEEAAKVADRHDTGDMRREDMEARRIAAAIRAMGQPK